MPAFGVADLLFFFSFNSHTAWLEAKRLQQYNIECEMIWARNGEPNTPWFFFVCRSARLFIMNSSATGLVNATQSPIRTSFMREPGAADADLYLISHVHISLSLSPSRSVTHLFNQYGQKRREK